jgi:membrane protein required for colicin V production
MNLVLLLVLVLAISFAVLGFRVGLVRRVVEFVGLVFSFFLATNLASRWSEPIAEGTGLSEKVAVYLAWGGIFLVGLVATRLLAWLISKSVRVSIIGWLDRLGGTVFGLLTGILIASVLLIVLTQLPGGVVLRETLDKQAVPRMVYRAAPALYDLFQKLGGDDRHRWEKLLEKVKERAKDAAEKVAVAPAPAWRG